MKIFVTGSASTIGKSICSKLIDTGFSVIGFDSRQSDLEHELYFHVNGDINDQLQLKKGLKDCGCIIHSAIFKGDYNKDLNKSFQANVIGTVNLYESTHQLNISKIILLSSAPVDKNFPNENSLAWKSDSAGDHMYDLTKRLQEEIARDYYETFKLPTIILRLGHIVNGKSHTDFQGKSLDELKYCLGGWVDYQDVSEAVSLAVKYSESRFDIFNIIGSELANDPFNIKRTIEKLGWNPVYRFS